MRTFEFKDAEGKVVTLSKREQLVCNEMKDKFNSAILMNDTSNVGAQIDINTLTLLLKTVSKQKFYELEIGKYVTIDTDGGWADQILQVREYLLFNPMSGFVDQSAHNAKMAVSEAAIDGIYQKAITWAKKIEFSIAEVNQAALVGNFNLVAAKERSRKKSYDLDMQQLAFLGYQGVNGILNQSSIVTTNTTLITKPISSMDATEINAFVGSLIETYRQNSARTAYPNTFVIPESDYNGLASQVSPQFPVKNKLQLLQDAIDLIANRHVDILPCAYSDTANNSLGVTRYALYNKDYDTMRLVNGIDYTNTMMNNVDGWNFTNVAFGRTFGVLINRPKEVIYFDR